ncbi:YciI-like protein [Massilia sp. DJPM01]|uniref:YciI-like protein n=1 Tax=Massilia sp. DJPM01 TaxID=3024404 RepID=UPI00259D84FC|nr:YciI-like protein [Massilia sp. DJPM01]MDM5176751.1 YciI-like protein [Massilia sp. DJPM01]
MHYLLCYDLAPDYLERRGQYRDEHLKLAWEAQERGEVIMGGAFSDPADMSVLMFQGDSPAVAEQFAKADPYLIHGVATGYKIRQWNTVVGKDAFAPVRPE